MQFEKSLNLQLKPYRLLFLDTEFCKTTFEIKTNYMLKLYNYKLSYTFNYTRGSCYLGSINEN